MSEVRKGYVRPLDIKHGQVDMAHGAGGRAMAQLIEELFARYLGNEYLAQGDDGALLPAQGAGKLVMATDCHVVSPLFFPGGDIGCLSVHGTINDVAVMGAKPLWLSAGFILEEGFKLADLARIVQSMADAALAAGVPIVTGDTKVERGKGDGVFITTPGVGVVAPGMELSGRSAKAGDVILVSGTLGDHGMAIMAVRESLGFESPIVSDTAALHGLIAVMRDSGAEIHVLRDPTRGGLATTLNEIAQQSGVGMMLQEKALPVRPAVNAACEFLGLDPLYVANEGKLVAICAENDAEKLLAAMQIHPLGVDAAIIGRVHEDAHHFVQMTTGFGGKRIVDWLSGEQLPRIC